MSLVLTWAEVGEGDNVVKSILPRTLYSNYLYDMLSRLDFVCMKLISIPFNTVDLSLSNMALKVG